MAGPVKYPGIPIVLGGVEYVVPPIALGALEQLQESIAGYSGNPLERGQIGTVVDAAHAALRRNYPDLTREQVADMIDVGNMADVFECVMDVSGLKRKAAEVIKPGELVAG